MRSIPPTDKSLADLTKDDIAAQAQADTMANTAILQSGLAGMNDWWTPAETFGKALVNKEITKDHADHTGRIASHDASYDFDTMTHSSFTLCIPGQGFQFSFPLSGK